MRGRTWRSLVSKKTPWSIPFLPIEFVSISSVTLRPSEGAEQLSPSLSLRPMIGQRMSLQRAAIKSRADRQQLILSPKFTRNLQLLERNQLSSLSVSVLVSHNIW